MQDCEILGKKHHLKFDGSSNITWLTGNLHFSCRNCHARVIVDRFYFYIAIRTPKDDWATWR